MALIMLMISKVHIASPLKIIVHDEWDLTDERFDADIALLITKEVPFTRFIKPICIWADSSVARAKAGFIAGWGRSEIEGFHQGSRKLFSRLSLVGKNVIKQNILCRSQRRFRSLSW